MEELVYRMFNGKKRTESEHERLIYKSTLDLGESHNIFYEKDSMVPCDVKMADRVFDAAVNLLEEVGILCTDTNRVIELDKTEIKRSLQNSCPAFTMGEGAESIRVVSRHILDRRVPMICGGPSAVPITENMFIPVHRSYAKINLVESIAPASFHSMDLEHHKFKGNPLNMLDAHKAVKFIKEACRLEGRGNICCFAPPFIDDPKAAISIANPEFMGHGDIQEIYPLIDLKANLGEISRAIHHQSIGSYYNSASILIMGGITTAIPEQFAVEMTAEVLKNKVLYQSQMSSIHPNHLQSPASRSPEVLWASFITSMAISRNSRYIHGTVINNFSGPCTESMMYETAVQTIGSTVCGSDYLSGPVSNAGNELNHSCGLDSLFMAKIAELATALSLKDANYLCTELYNKYSGKKPEFGKTFEECYDLKTIEPSEEYYTIYEQSMGQVYDLLV
ncbi:MAG: monomethylamine:corrinoid methyltransferase [Methanosarcinaceae archaeon]|nr:monomethylamine:corrinoid methyltransferase [Methanosarcinaceae archaeon]